MLVLNHVLVDRFEGKISMYADDGFFYFDKKLGIDLTRCDEMGIKFNMSKTG